MFPSLPSRSLFSIFSLFLLVSYLFPLSVSGAFLRSYSLPLFTLHFTSSLDSGIISDPDFLTDFSQSLESDIYSSIDASYLNSLVGQPAILNGKTANAGSDQLDSTISLSVSFIPAGSDYEFAGSSYSSLIQQFRSELDRIPLGSSRFLNGTFTSYLSTSFPYTFTPNTTVSACTGNYYTLSSCPEPDPRRYAGKAGLAAGIIISLLLLLTVAAVVYHFWRKNELKLREQRLKGLPAKERRLVGHRHNSRLKQHQLPVWKPKITKFTSIMVFICMGGVCFLFGGILLSANSDLSRLAVRYDSLPQCRAQNNFTVAPQSCTVEIIADRDIDPPMYFYYGLDNYYQNHRFYVKSRSPAQLMGKGSINYANCEPLVSFSQARSVENMNQSQVAFSLDKRLYPCGLIAQSFFPDSFDSPCIVRQNRFGITECTPLSFTNWKKRGIAWQTDLDRKFSARAPSASETPFTPSGQVLPPVDDEEFVVWMRVEAAHDFTKLYRRIENRGLKTGERLRVTIRNRLDTARYGSDSAKYIILATANWSGGKNPFLYSAYFAVGSWSLLLALVVAIRFQQKSHQRMEEEED